MARKSPNSTPVASTKLSPPTKESRAREARPTVASLAADVAALTEAVQTLAGVVSQGQAPAQEPPAKNTRGSRKGSRKAADSESKWAKGTRFVYVKKNGAESTFRVVEVLAKRVRARNEGTGFTSTFKLTTLDALLQADVVRPVA